MAAPRVLLIDNFDSYTFNLFQLLAELYEEPPLVVENDRVTVAQIKQLVSSGVVHHIVISPGPGTPSEPHDIGVCLEVLHQLPHVPVLGVCLGHQALAIAHGGRVARAPEPVHGRLSAIHHEGHMLFDGCPSGPASGFDVVRYHSLVVEAASLPPCLQPIAWACTGHHAVQLVGDVQLPAGESAAAVAASLRQQQEQHALQGRLQPQQQQVQQLEWQQSAPELPGQEPGHGLIMALAHTSRPHWGVQFHPESIATRYGMQLLANFRRMACAVQGMAVPHALFDPEPACQPMTPWPWPPAAAHPAHKPLQLPQQLASQAAEVGAAVAAAAAHRLPRPEQEPVCSLPAAAAALGPGRAGCELRLLWRRVPGVLGKLGGSQALFEALVGPVDDSWWLDSSATDRGRFSYMGGRGGPLWRRITYHEHSHPAAEQQQQQQLAGSHPASTVSPQHILPCEDCARPNGACSTPNGGTCGSAGGGAAGSSSSASSTPGGLVTATDAAGTSVSAQLHLWEYLREQLALLALRCRSEEAAQLPHNFWGGFVGYLGYELKSECGGAAATAPHVESGACGAAAVAPPDAALFFADRLLAVDHEAGDVYCLALYDASSTQAASAPAAQVDAAGATGPTSMNGGCAPPPMANGANGRAAANGCAAAGSAQASAVHWLEGTSSRIEQLATALPADGEGSQQACRAAAGAHGISAACSDVCATPRSQQQHQPPPWRLHHSRDRYLAAIAACQAALAAGESYELCLTTALSRAAPACPAFPWRFYSTLRRINPAPYAAWLRFAPPLPPPPSSPLAADSSAAGQLPPAAAAGQLPLTICCSSPERFLRCDRGGVLEARPIKGTARRALGDADADAALAAALVSSEKERAENLMIVDLLRNDLGRVCAVGSVHVPGLIQLESYATVHQLVSTVRGLRAPLAAGSARAAAAALEPLASAPAPGAKQAAALPMAGAGAAAAAAAAAPGLVPEADPAPGEKQAAAAAAEPAAAPPLVSMVDCIRAAFPGGSMTGAPKLRSMVLLDAIEGRRRGVYSGSIGFLSVNDTFDLNIVIRTAVFDCAGGVSVGAGGAIVVQSEAGEEYEEMRLKATALLRAMALAEAEAGGLGDGAAAEVVVFEGEQC